LKEMMLRFSRRRHPISDEELNAYVDGEIAGEGRAGDTGVTGLLPPPQARANATVAS